MKILTSLLLVTVVLASVTPTAFACLVCEHGVQCVQTFSYGYEVCVTGQPGDPCHGYYQCTNASQEMLAEILTKIESGQFSGKGVRVFVRAGGQVATAMGLASHSLGQFTWTSTSGHSVQIVLT